MKTAPARTVIGSSLLAALAAACSAPPYDEADEHYYRNEPDAVLEAYGEAALDDGRNALLGSTKLLSASLLKQDRVQAMSFALRCSLLVNIFVAGEAGERDALGLLGQEKDKPFKGEPHERVMVDYYLGVLRFQAGDHEGALAAFRSAMQKDRGTFLLPVEEREAREGSDNVQRFVYDDDYALLHFLAAKCYSLLGEPEEAEEHLARAKAIEPEIDWLFEEGMEDGTNVLVLVEGGHAPIKRKTGPQGAILGYEEAPRVRVEEVSFDGDKVSYAQCEDLYHQATTLGGRAVDDLNLAKAKRQEALQLAGFAASMAGSWLAVAGSESGSHSMETAGLIAMGVGAAVMIFSAVAIDPSADVRAWTSLPGQIFLAVGKVPPGKPATLRVHARGLHGGDLSQRWTGVPVEEGSNLYWVRLLPGRGGGSWLPPPPEAGSDRVGSPDAETRATTSPSPHESREPQGGPP
jgi:tetratricopeptide (TPR) repeat protein